MSEERSAVVLPEDSDPVGMRERDKEGVSRNGSLGARARLGVSGFESMTGFCLPDGSGCDCERVCGDAFVALSNVRPEDTILEDWASSNPRTCQIHEITR
jgi:hypothetical protein